jgi:hypothetical protein
MLASMQAAPVGVAIDAADVFWANQGTSPSYADGAIFRYSFGSAKLNKVTPAAEPIGVALSPNLLHWVNASGNTVGVIAPDGNSPGQTSLPASLPEGLAVDGQNVYVSLALQLGDGGVGGGIVSIPLATNAQPVTPFVETPLIVPRVAVGVMNVYWTEVDFTSETTLLMGGSVWQASKSARTPTPLVTGEPSPFAIATDDAYVYWSTAFSALTGVGGVVKRVNLAGPKTTTQLGQSALPILALAVDGSNVYWAEYGKDASIYQTAKGGGGAAIYTLAKHQLYPRAIAAGSGLVAWVNAGTGTEVDGGSGVVFDAMDGSVWVTPIHP